MKIFISPTMVDRYKISLITEFPYNVISKVAHFQPTAGRGDWICGSGKWDTGKNARVENTGEGSKGGKCRSSL